VRVGYEPPIRAAARTASRPDLAPDSRTASVRAILTLLSGNLLGAAAGGVFFLTASHHFDLAMMGHYALAISAQFIAVGLLGTGLSVATVRIATDRLLAGAQGAAAGAVAISASIAIGVSVGAALLSTLAAGLISDSFVLSSRATTLVVLWAGARSLQDCIRAGLLAERHFGRAALLMVMSAGTGLTALTVTVLSGPLTLERMLTAHVLGLGTAAIAGSLLLAPIARSGVQVSRAQLRELVAYARWPSLSEGTRLLQTHLGPIALVALAGSSQAGLFSLGRYPAILFDVIAVSLYQFWLPTAAMETRQTDLLSFSRRQMLVAGVLGLAMVLAALALRPALSLLGPNFETARHLFVLNAIDFALLLVVRPIEASFHGLHQPRLELFLRLGILPLLLVATFVLVPRFGAEGMVFAHILAGLLAAPLALWLLRRALGRAESPRDG
jgi:O-antigen/teichoic acid export membrane protein